MELAERQVTANKSGTLSFKINSQPHMSAEEDLYSRAVR